MNPPPAPELTEGLAEELRAFQSLCEEALSLTTREHQALAEQTDYQPCKFDQKRKDLLPGLESALVGLRTRRQLWQQTRQTGPARSEEVKTLFQAIQNLLMRTLLLDRENQQAMLRRGLVPAWHLPAAGGQQPHYVTSLYQRHSRVDLQRSSYVYRENYRPGR